MRILIIEDDEATANYIQKGLVEAGHTADVASQGDTGLEKASSESYQALIVDRMLPVMDGLTMVTRLREKNINTLR